MEETLIETWNIHNRINLYLLAVIPAEAMGSSLTAKSRTIRYLFTHTHNVRVMWLKASAPEFLEGLAKLETKSVVTKEQLGESLTASSRAIERLLRKGIESGGRIKGFQPHAAAFLGYLISHESHHRGQIEYVLRHCGHPLPDGISYGLWEWGVR